MTLTQVSTGGIKDGQVHTADLADAQITAGKLHADALDHTYTLGASGTDHYTFTGEGLTGAVNDPTLYLTRGKTYRFVNGNSGGAHPFRIQSVAGAGGTEYNTGVTNNAGAGGSTIIFEVPHDAPDVLYYICTSHATMNGIFYVTGALADGTVTTAKLADDAVTDAKLANSINTAIAANTAKTSNATHTGDVTGSTSLTIADDAVTTAKLAADAVTSAKIADDAVTGDHVAADAISTSHIADNSILAAQIANEAVTLAKLPHGDGSSDGKFLRSNNGADPTFESLPSSGVTVSNNSNDRVVTGDGTNLVAESALTFNGTHKLSITASSNGGTVEIIGAEGENAGVVLACDQFDDHADKYALESNAGDNAFRIMQGHTGGSGNFDYRNVFNINSSGSKWMGAYSGYSGGNTMGSNAADTGSFAARFDGVGAGVSNCLQFVNAYGQVGAITFNAGTTYYNTSSDYRLKENDVSISDGITKVKQLRPIRFNWKANKALTVDGFIAHEVTPVVPEAVVGEKDATQTTYYGGGDTIPEGKKEGDVKEENAILPQQLDAAKLIPVLTAALQEAITKIETLETKVAALEAG